MILNTIKKLCLERKIKWSAHAAARIRERGLCREDVLECIKNGELIEDYPKDFPHPSCLIYGHAVDNRIIHVVVGCDEDYAYIITAYVPNLQKFESDLKTRKEC